MAGQVLGTGTTPRRRAVFGLLDAVPDGRARAAGATPSTIFALVKKIRAYSDVPIVFLTYYNIVFRRGIERFYEEAGEAGKGSGRERQDTFRRPAGSAPAY